MSVNDFTVQITCYICDFLFGAKKPPTCFHNWWTKVNIDNRICSTNHLVTSYIFFFCKNHVKSKGSILLFSLGLCCNYFTLIHPALIRFILLPKFKKSSKNKVSLTIFFSILMIFHSFFNFGWILALQLSRALCWVDFSLVIQIFWHLNSGMKQILFIQITVYLYCKFGSVNFWFDKFFGAEK